MTDDIHSVLLSCCLVVFVVFVVFVVSLSILLEQDYASFYFKPMAMILIFIC
jgi:hypothetical protein